MLLSKRLYRPTNLALRGVSIEKTWDALYELRSCVAHGATPDFSRGLLANLKASDHAVGLVRESCRSLIRQALEEPELMADLKDC